MYDRETTLALLHEYTKTDGLRRHAYAVQAAMVASARRTGTPAAWRARMMRLELVSTIFPVRISSPVVRISARMAPPRRSNGGHCTTESTQAPMAGRYPTLCVRPGLWRGARWCLRSAWPGNQLEVAAI